MIMRTSSYTTVSAEKWLKVASYVSHGNTWGGNLLGPGANLQSARLSYANLANVDLTGANLTSVSLVEANLTGANLTR